MLDWFCLRFVSPFLSLLARSHNLQISKKHRRLFWVLTIHLAARTTRRTASTTMLSPDCRATALIFPPLTSISCPQVEKDLNSIEPPHCIRPCPTGSTGFCLDVYTGIAMLQPHRTQGPRRCQSHLNDMSGALCIVPFLTSRATRRSRRAPCSSTCSSHTHISHSVLFCPSALPFLTSHKVLRP